ncbi:MAG: 2Fe-2S iron-sulfur cluster-binding protein, partial [Haloechinothrix sp.]
MSANFRLPDGGIIDRDEKLHFTFNGRSLAGYRGDTLASALLANGVHQVATSIKYGRPRGVMAAGAEEANALVQIEEPFPEPMLPATTVELYDGLAADGLSGQGRLADEPDPARYDAKHVHCDVLIVGAGPAGLIAALSAARSGARVVLIDDQNQAGGSLLGTDEYFDLRPSAAWVSEVVSELRNTPGVRVLERTTAFGAYDDGFVLALQRRTDHLGAAAPETVARQRIWRIRAKQTVIATGAHERPVVFAGNDRPGIMLAGAARTYLHRYGVLPGRRVVVFTTNDSAYTAAIELAEAGVDVPVLVDARAVPPSGLAAECAARGIEVRAGHVVTGTEGDERITDAHIAPLTDGATGPTDTVICDALLVSGGWNPVVHLFSQVGGTLRYAPEVGAFVPGEELSTVRVAGSATGAPDLTTCARQGREAGRTAAIATGFNAGAEVPLPVSDARLEETAAAVLWRVPDGEEPRGV